MLPSGIPKLPTYKCFLMFVNFSSFKTPFPGRISVPTSFVFLSFIFCPTSFWRQWAAFLGAWCLPAFRSFLWNLLSVQMLFWWICGGESGLPILFLHHLRTTLAPGDVSKKSTFEEKETKMLRITLIALFTELFFHWVASHRFHISLTCVY